MPDAPLGRRERNKQAKLERITAAAGELFARHGIDEVTTHQIAEAADIGTGTLFLYARNKAELLLLVQNSHYATALERGRAAAAHQDEALQALLALLTPIIECNRVHVGNGRTYLREMVFGDPAEPHHAQALAISGRTGEAIAGILIEHLGVTTEDAAKYARVASAIMFLTMASSEYADSSVEDIVGAIRSQVQAVLPH
ncbi:TetR/AcrR family transcriptional regulator [Galactobacter sp.]|uniref:TetR/AcrR family transcriptional regulator n=1 Tax=Galactobacter sp. TaxID=2676125 RepID=UPI0025C46516|nr:TetR/AcrR family transcriptional regulator [Galactobacter sp.]